MKVLIFSPGADVLPSILIEFVFLTGYLVIFGAALGTTMGPWKMYQK